MNGRTLLLAGLLSLSVAPGLVRADWHDRDKDGRDYHGEHAGERGYRHDDSRRDYHADHAGWERDAHPNFPRRDGQFGDRVNRGDFGRNGIGGDRAIGSGIRSGELTGREVQGLEAEKRNIADEERRYGADGYLTSKEREDLEKDTAAYHKDLNHELNDGEHR